jgi:hypothetical protein
MRIGVDNLNINSVLDPDLDPYVFEPPGSVITLYRSRLEKP